MLELINNDFLDKNSKKIKCTSNFFIIRNEFFPIQLESVFVDDLKRHNIVGRFIGNNEGIGEIGKLSKTGGIINSGNSLGSLYVDIKPVVLKMNSCDFMETTVSSELFKCIGNKYYFSLTVYDSVPCKINLRDIRYLGKLEDRYVKLYIHVSEWIWDFFDFNIDTSELFAGDKKVGNLNLFVPRGELMNYLNTI